LHIRILIGDFAGDRKSFRNVMKKREWNKYIHHNKSTYGDCQLINALNAYYYLTGKVYCAQRSKKYERLVNLCKCRHGAAIGIEKVWDKIGITENKRYVRDDKPRFLKQNSFLEVIIWSKFYGFHSVSVVDYIKRADCLRITNFGRIITKNNGWMFWEDLCKYLCENPDKSEPRYEFRTFKLK